MANLQVSFSTAEQALTAATARTILQLISPANQRALVKQVFLSFDGTSGTAEPVNVRILRQTNAIGGTPTTVTGVRIGAGSETPQITAAASAGGTEPTAGDILYRFTIHPQGGIILPLPLDVELVLPGGTRLGIEITAPATVNVTSTVIVEE